MPPSLLPCVHHAFSPALAPASSPLNLQGDPGQTPTWKDISAPSRLWPCAVPSSAAQRLMGSGYLGPTTLGLLSPLHACVSPRKIPWAFLGAQCPQLPRHRHTLKSPLPAPTSQVCSVPHGDLGDEAREPLVSSCDKTLMETESWTLVNVPVSNGHLGKVPHPEDSGTSTIMSPLQGAPCPLRIASCT